VYRRSPGFDQDTQQQVKIAGMARFSDPRKLVGVSQLPAVDGDDTATAVKDQQQQPRIAAGSSEGAVGQNFAQFGFAAAGS